MFIHFNISNLLFILIMISSSLFSISTPSFINMWMGMEVNLMAFIPLMINNSNSLSSESMMKYFLIQSLASANFLFMTTILFIISKWFTMFSFKSILIMILLNVSLLMKMGAAPLHFWFPKVVKGLSWNNCMILMTWQKIIPMIIISYYFIETLVIFFIIFSCMTGSIMGLNQTSMLMIMTYSSINHISWMLSCLILNTNLWFMYFLIYSLMTIIMILNFNLIQIFNLIQLYSKKIPFYLNFLILMNFLSMGGLPPFLGFLPKWITLNMLINNNFYWLSMMLIFTSLISLFFYIRISYSFLVLNFPKMKSNFIMINKINSTNLLYYLYLHLYHLFFFIKTLS
uniref:NADH-ubiquinone oxidoreductase chain 2 n=1 Tax=Phryganopsyche latipennis TaxID=177652 RepID=A0A4Y1JWJ2_9NEOP|nr:NADH dehydrogenase subunit 2 [Phryganopsyche latipennis]APQ47890.1 NADH dehydrogenase subunit 2 [Phryganopsyche latipennis]